MPALGTGAFKSSGCIGKEDNYFLRSALNAGLSHRCYAIPGWAGVAPEGLMLWASMGSPARGLPDSLQC